jgi:hypothetical protein
MSGNKLEYFTATSVAELQHSDVAAAPVPQNRCKIKKIDAF